MLIRLSPHLTVFAFVQTRHREFMQEQRSFPMEALVAARRLAQEVFEPAWAALGALAVTSGYRCPLLNELVGGSEHSAHMFGRAVDVVPEQYHLRDAMLMLEDSGVAYDKAILEVEDDEAWIHLQVARDGLPPRRAQFMTFDERHYPPFDENDPRVLRLVA